MTLHARAVSSIILSLLLSTAGLAANDSHVRSLFENAVKDTGKHGQIPVLVPTVLPKELALKATAVVDGSEEKDKNGYSLSLFADSGSGYSGFMGSFMGSRMDPAASNEPRDSKPVQLANGTTAHYRPVSCGGSCAPASLWWRTAMARYTIQLDLDSTLSEQRQRAVLLEVANSMIVSSRQ